MLSNGSETHRTSRPEVAGMVKMCLKFSITSAIIETLPKIIGKVTITRRVSNMEKTTENYFNLKSQGLKRAEIATAFGMTEGQLKKYITKMGWAKPRPTIGREDAFDSLNEFSCYWGGFLASDGNVDGKNRVRLMLNYDDTAHLVLVLGSKL